MLLAAHVRRIGSNHVVPSAEQVNEPETQSRFAAEHLILELARSIGPVR